jgi:hypothetical protein
MSEPTYGSGQYDPQQGYSGQPYGGQQYGGPPSQQQPYPTGQQQPGYGGGYGQQPQPGGYPSGSYPAAGAPSAPRKVQDKIVLAATLVTIVGYVCAGAGVLGFILWLAADGDGISRFATALSALVAGIGLGGINYAIGAWLGTRSTSS